MGKETVNQVQEAQRVPSRLNTRRNTPRHVLIKLTKIKFKEKTLKAAREKQKITYKGNPIRLSADFSAETLQAIREWQDIVKVMKEKNLQPRLLYPARIPFRFDGEIRSFSGVSLVAQWLRICLPMQGTRVRALVWEDHTCYGATRPVSHNY